MARIRRRYVIPIVALAVVACGIAAVVPPHAVLPRLVGTGGYTATIVRDVPHPFRFDRPRTWDEAYSPTWTTLVLGPRSDDDVFFTNLTTRVRPSAARSSEYPEPGGPYPSLEGFVLRALPKESQTVVEAPATVDSRPALDAVYRYTYYPATTRVPPPSTVCMTRVVSFEDRGYYYSLALETHDAEYERYAEVFDRMVGSFHFLD